MNTPGRVRGADAGDSDAGEGGGGMSGLTAGEREALMAWWNADWPHDGSDVLDALAVVVKGILAARLAAVEALADKWEAEVVRFGQTPAGDPIRAGLIEGYRDAAASLRAALEDPR